MEKAESMEASNPQPSKAPKKTQEKHVCPRCHVQVADKYTLMRHLKAKTLCSPTFSDAKPEDIIAELRTWKYTEDDEQCEFCLKRYSSKQTLNRHKRVCKVAQKQLATGTSLKNDSLQEIEALKAQVQRLQELVLQKHTTVINHNTVTNNVTNNVTNVTNNIQLNALGKENVEYITSQPNYTNFMKACIRDRAEGVCKFLVRKHFHEEHPENHNVRKKVKKDAFINVYDGKEWRPKLVNEALEQLFAGMERQFALFADVVTESGEINKAWLDRFMQEVGIPLEWDFSSENYEYEHEMPQDKKEAFKKDLFKLALEYICQHSKKQQM